MHVDPFLHGTIVGTYGSFTYVVRDGHIWQLAEGTRLITYETVAAARAINLGDSFTWRETTVAGRATREMRARWAGCSPETGYCNTHRCVVG